MEQPKNNVPKWLKRLQENSWEIELLISGGAVFTLLQFPEHLIEFLRLVKTTSDIPGTGMLTVMGMAGIKILTNGFILHLLLRAFWLAMVCINYTFPQGIKPEKMKRAFPFKSPHVEGDLRDYIMQVDRLSGLVIFMTILSTLILLGLTFGAIVLITILNNLPLDQLYSLTIERFFISSLLVYFIDLLLMGLFRRLPIVSWLLFPFFWLYDFITFRSIYNRPLALFSSNVRRPVFYTGSLIFILVTGIVTYTALERTLHWPRLFDARAYRDQLTDSNKVMVSRYYADQSTAGQRGLLSIPSFLIEQNVLQVNLRYDRWMDQLLDHSHPDPQSRYLSSIIDLYIDDSLYSQVKWMEVKESLEHQLGLVAMVDITGLANGNHRVTVQSKELDDPKYRKIRSETIEKVTIEFWKDVH